jgi:ferric-dicitrate binding protein FerR (iron transport regulator)
MSPDDLGFDPLDDDLARRLHAAMPAAGAADAVLESLRPRLQAARRRRHTAMVGVSGATVAALLAVVLTVAHPSGSNGNVRITPATGEHTTTTVVRRGFTPPPSSPVPKSGSNGGTGTSPTPTPPHANPAPAGGGAAAPPETHTYTSAGGSITVRLADGALALVSTQPAAGFSEDRHDTGPSRVEVRFDDGQTEWRIRVDVADGHLSVEITHDGGSSP